MPSVSDMLSVVQLSIVMLSVKAVCVYGECH
jgi:hypothetical protein